MSLWGWWQCSSVHLSTHIFLYRISHTAVHHRRKRINSLDEMSSENNGGGKWAGQGLRMWKKMLDAYETPSLLSSQAPELPNLIQASEWYSFYSHFTEEDEGFKRLETNLAPVMASNGAAILPTTVCLQMPVPERVHVLTHTHTHTHSLSLSLSLWVLVRRKSITWSSPSEVDKGWSQSLVLQPSGLILVTWQPLTLAPLTVHLQSASTLFLTPILHVTSPTAIVASLKTVLWLKKIMFVFLKDYSCRKEQREISCKPLPPLSQWQYLQNCSTVYNRKADLDTVQRQNISCAQGCLQRPLYNHIPFHSTSPAF